MSAFAHLGGGGLGVALIVALLLGRRHATDSDLPRNVTHTAELAVS